jgi:ABC-type Na+ efflux pump permease subunit
MFGGVWPVVQRELRETARRPLNHWLRVAGAGAGVLTFFFLISFFLTADVPGPFIGLQLFNSIHLLLLFLICIFVPAITADCIASERREGTLGLLFMTPLTASAIVLGKILARVLRAFILWLAVLPLLTIPFLYGGISWGNVVVFLTTELCVAMLCLAAGILASCSTDNRARSYILAFLLTWALMHEAGQYQSLRMMRYARVVVAPPMMRGPGSYANYMYYVQNGFNLVPIPFGSGFAGPWCVPAWGVTRTPAPPPPASIVRRIFSNDLVHDFFIAAVILLVSIRIAGWRVERSWQDKIPSARQQNWVKRYCTPIFSHWFARRMQSAMERNPIVWLQQYSWKSRLSKWGLGLLFLIIECSVIDNNSPDSIEGMTFVLILILAAAYTYAGVNGFLQEKKTGALELILVSPISVKQIIFGRALGLWKQFIPATLVLGASYVAARSMIRPYAHFYFPLERDPQIGFIGLEFIALYLLLPIIATYCALRFKNLFAAAAWTWIALLVPVIVTFIVTWFILRDTAPYFAIVAGNCILAVIIFNRLDTDLTRRSYTF